MTLRARLTFLYATLLGGILLLFGMGVYGLVNVMLTRQVDSLLNNTALEILEVTRVDSVGELTVLRLPPLGMTANVYVQVWDREGHLQASSLGNDQIDQSFDPAGLMTSQPVFRTVKFQNVHMRVFSVPLIVGKRPVGILQAATSLNVIDSVRQDLLYVLIVAAIISMALAALGSWFVIGQALAPLETVVETAEQINRADDLSRRIPYHGPPDDEIGQLIHTFNQTLERLENLFTSQHRFLADVSHELRTPLTVIKGNVGLMRRMQTIDEETLTSIDQESNRLTRLVGDLLLLAQAETGKLPLNQEPVELDTLLLEVLQEMHVLAGDKVRLKITDIDQVLVNGDRDRLKQVLLNLVANAIQYTPAGGEVFLSLSKVGEQARLIVRDTGPGIPKEAQKHIFERFYRAEKSRTRSKSSGFGLGLSIAYWIVTQHGGRIEVDSKDGQGTTFCIWLPLLANSN
ncbi:MAG: sensor histidine kinase [Chloroflexi bacterium]|nr:sensor histidine kinase [Chloroflexota bacterium]